MRKKPKLSELSYTRVKPKGVPDPDPCRLCGRDLTGDDHVVFYCDCVIVKGEIVEECGCCSWGQYCAECDAWGREVEQQLVRFY